MRAFFFIVLFLLTQFASGQNIGVLNESKIELGMNTKALTELHLTVHPKNDSWLLLSGMQINPKESSEYGVFTAISKDGGKKWSHLKMFHVAEGADPWSQIASNGKAFTSVLGLEDLVIYRSNDAGSTWEKDSLNVGRGFDHQTMTWDRSNDNIYLVSIRSNKIYLNTATKNNVFDAPKEFTFSNLSSNTMTPVVLSNGKVLIPFTTFQKRTIDENDKVQQETLQKTLSWVVEYDPQKAMFGASSMICIDCERGFPVMAADQSEGSYKDRLYYVCSSQSTSEILFYYSTTKGDSWSKAKIIKQYFKGEHTRRNKFTGIPQVAVNNKGEILVVWQDRTDDPTNKCQYLYGAISKDGGKTFTTPQKISSQLSCQENTENGWAGERYKSGGDYLGISSKQNGNFIVIWPDSRGGISQLFIAELQINQ